jgi:Acetyltransferases
MERYINLIEEISLNAWPAHKMELYDGWLLRFSHNYTHRTNCVNPVSNGCLALDEKIQFCEQEYTKFHTPTIFKISPLLDASFEASLSDRGYEIQHTTEVMTMNLVSEMPAYDMVQLSDTITDDWIMNLFHLNRTTNPVHLKIVPSMFKAIPKETIVARIEADGKMVASGLGIVDRGHVGLYAIYVDADYRQKQYGKAICSAIMNQALKKGAENAYLQVVSDNDIAKILYHNLGFEYLYTYWFRVK